MRLLDLKDIVLKAENQFVPSPLHIACKAGYQDICLALLDKLDTEEIVSTYNDDMPIHLLLDQKSEHLEVARAILEKINSDKRFMIYHTVLHALNQKKSSLLQIAIDNGHLKIADMILEHYYPDNFCADGNGQNPTHLSANNGNLDVLDILVKLNFKLLNSHPNFESVGIDKCLLIYFQFSR